MHGGWSKNDQFQIFDRAKGKTTIRRVLIEFGEQVILCDLCLRSAIYNNYSNGLVKYSKVVSVQ